jgi:hypothetical protein
MRSLSRSAAVVLASCALLVSGSAVGQTVRVSDPAGDGLKGRRLDITAVKMSNRDHAIVVKISVVRVAHGDLGVRMKARGDRGETALVASQHRSSGDTNQLFTAAGEQQCNGLRVTWDQTADRVLVRVPSRCIDGGDYGAVRAKAIFEIGSDADFAPKGPKGGWRWTDYVARG